MTYLIAKQDSTGRSLYYANRFNAPNLNRDSVTLHGYWTKDRDSSHVWRMGDLYFAAAAASMVDGEVREI